MNLLKTFSKYAVGSLVTLVVGFLSTMILTRLISTEEMGKYSMFITVGGLVSSFLYLGLDQSYVRFYYDEDEHSRVMLLKKCMVFPMLLTAGASVLLLLFSDLFSEYLVGEPSFVITVLFCIYLLGLVADRFLLMKVRMAQKAVVYSVLNILRKLAYLLLAILLFYLAFGGKSITLILPVTIAEIVVILGAVYVEKDSFRSARKAQSKELKTDRDQLLRYGIPFIFSTTITIIFHSTDKFMLKELTDYDQIGLYTGAQNIVNLISQVQTVFSTFWMPVAFEHFNKDPGDRQFYIRINRLVSYGMLMLFVLVLLTKDIIIYFLGSDYRDASFIFPFLAFMPIMYTVSETTVLGINFMKKSGYHVWISLACAVANIIGNFFLITRFGAVGAAISTGISYILFFVLRTILANRVYPVKYSNGRFALACALVSVLATLACFFHVTWWYLLTGVVILALISLIYRDVLKEGISFVKRRFLNKNKGKTQ